MDAKKIETLIDTAKSLPHVADASRWTKGDKDRIYINVRSQNRMPSGVTMYIDLATGELVCKLGGASGAKTCAWAEDIRDAMEEALESMGADVVAESDADASEATEAANATDAAILAAWDRAIESQGATGEGKATADRYRAWMVEQASPNAPQHSIYVSDIRDRQTLDADRQPMTDMDLAMMVYRTASRFVK